MRLAELLGVSRQSFEGWKSGKAPSKDNQHRLEVLYQAAQRFEAAGLEANLSTKRRLIDSELEFMQALAHDQDPLDAVKHLTELVERGNKQRAALEFFRGEWTIKGYESTYRESCDWLAGNGFIACHAEDRSETTPSFSMSVFGYSETDGQYTYNGFSSLGTQRSLQGYVEDGV